jgi:hypothetical protein
LKQLLAISSWLLAMPCWMRSYRSTQQRDWLQTWIVKEREHDLSQLNRLGVAYFLVVYFRFLPRITLACFLLRLEA